MSTEQTTTRPVQEFLTELRTLDVRLWVEDHQLRYKAPKGTLTPDRINQLRAYKAEILAFLQQAQCSELPELPALVRASREATMPLSFGQQRLWFLNQLESNKTTYNMPLAFHLQGTLSVAALKHSLQCILHRHETLRTYIPVVGETPMQEINAKATLNLPIIHLKSLSKVDQAADLQKLVNEDFQRPFDLSKGPLLRMTLVQLAADSHALLVTMHHIISDGWSLGLFTQELSTFYTAYLAGDLAPLPELTIQYADFAQWQRQWLQGELLEEQINYWKQQLAELTGLLELPTDLTRPTVQKFQGRNFLFQLDLELTQQLKELSQRSGVTLFMTLLAAFKVLLSRYSRQKDIVVGSPIANRNLSDIEPLIGFFVNTLVLRTDLSGNPTFLDLLSRVRKTALDAYAHQDVPFEKLVEELNPERNLSYHPLFQVMFVFQNTKTDAVELPDLTLTNLSPENITSKFDLTLSLKESTQGLAATWEYDSDLFENDTIQRLAGHFQYLLKNIVATPQASIETLPILSAPERHQLLVDWNNTQTNYPRHQCVHELFEKQVEQTPDEIALIFQNQQLTYRELNLRANQLAHALKDLGIGTETFVGICVNRSMQMIIGLLAILKSGGTYVPLDPAYPSERLAFMLEDTQISVLLTEQNLSSQFAAFSLSHICLDTYANQLQEYSNENPGTCTTSDNLAYLMYTSGSTGRPKGVCVRHHSVVRLVKNTNYAQMDADEVFLQLAPVAFDASTLEIWGALLNGARLVLFPHSKPTLADIGQVIDQHQVSILWLTAGLFHLMVDEYLDGLIPVRQLLAGGDTLSVPHVKKVVEQLKDCTVINGYGPTENTTFTCYHPISELKNIGNSIPIGRPISNTQVYILDEHLQPTPIGVPGELYIGGDGVAQGYFDRPELSQERFIPSPFLDNNSSSLNSVLYKTGDLVRYRLDGTIEFLGRLDNQVKIRGFRIELGEIEATISLHPQVKESVVIARAGSSGEKILIAYIVNKSSKDSAQSLTFENLSHYLKQKVPVYMVPSILIPLEELPLTPNGKVDRKALPAPPANIEAHQRDISLAAQDELEIQLCTLWESVLGRNHVGVTDNFFNLGGHSLLAIQLCAQIEKKFKQRLPLATLFGNPTISELASVLRNSDSVSYTSLVKIQDKGNLKPFFFINSVGHAKRLTPYLSPEQPFYGLSMFGTPCKSKAQPSQSLIQDIATYFISDLRKVQPHGPYFLGAFCLDSKLGLEIAQQLKSQGEEIAVLILIDAIWGAQKSQRYHYWKNLRTLGFEYVFVKLQNGLSKTYQSFVNYLGRLKYNTFQKIDEEFINTISDRYLEERNLLISYDKYAKMYKPNYYPGKVISIVCSEFRNYDHSTLFSLANNIEVHSIHGFHSVIFEKPYIRNLGKRINKILLTENKHY